jgi:hypothetical protein
MIVPIIAICPICGKKTYLRIEDGSYLKEYPIRVNCINCRALIKGTYIMSPRSARGLNLINAETEECDVDSETQMIRNADYVAEISGELPCKTVRAFDGHLIFSSPFLEAADNVESIVERKERLSYFTKNMEDWKKRKSTAFQLLDEGSIEYIAMALNNKMGEYTYECDNYLKSLHCLQEVVLEETKYLFLKPTQDDCITDLLKTLSLIDGEQLHELAKQIGGVQEILFSYRKAIEVFSDFMSIYPNLLPAETFIRFDKKASDVGIATCSFSDIKSFYQDAYESLLSLMYIPVCIDNIHNRGDYQSFAKKAYSGLFKQKRFSDISDDFHKYQILANGKKLEKLNTSESLQKAVNIPADSSLRNGIGHNNYKYDGITQTVTAFDLKDPSLIKYQSSLMEVAVDCIGLAKSSVIIAEIILYLLRHEFRKEGVHSIMHPRFYKGAEPNGKCPCGSGIKYKKCCRNELEKMIYKNDNL